MVVPKPLPQQPQTIAKTSPPLPSTETSSTMSTNTDNNTHTSSFTPAHYLFLCSIPVWLGAYAGYRIELTQAAVQSSENYSPGSTGMASSSSVLSTLSRAIHGPAEVSYPTTTSGSGGGSVASGSISGGGGATVTSGHHVRTAAAVAGGGNGGQATAGSMANAARLGFKALGIGSLLSMGGVGLLSAAVFYASGCDSLQDLLSTWKQWAPARRREMEAALGLQPKSMQHEDVKATANMTEDEEWDFIKKKYIPELVGEEPSRNEEKRNGGKGGEVDR